MCLCVCVGARSRLHAAYVCVRACVRVRVDFVDPVRPVLEQFCFDRPSGDSGMVCSLLLYGGVYCSPL